MEENKEKKEKTGFMAQGRSVIIAVIAALSAIIYVSIFIGELVDYKKSGGGSGITATGSASCGFGSDLIVWRGSFSVHGDTPRDAYTIIKKDTELVRQYLEENRVADDEMVFSSVNISQTHISRYGEEGKCLGDEPDGYDLTQSLTVSSCDINKVENISRDITKLIRSGVEFESELPEYYYTRLDEVKLDLIEKAIANARERIDIMSAGSGAKTGKLLSATLDASQITAKNSESESYSYDRYLSTSSRYKTANTAMRLNYVAEQAVRPGQQTGYSGI